jgi:sugar O-acyltransferase (sialic acid O-acetyltransferase NeuD family)
MTPPILIIGGGGYARVLIDTLLLQDMQIVGYTDIGLRQHSTIRGIPYIGDDNAILSYKPQEILLVNALGSVASTKNRQNVFDLFKRKGYVFASVIHSSAIISPDTILAEGVQIMAGAILQAGAQIGANTIVNTKASVDHDCMVGPHVHIAPGVTLSGEVVIESGVHIGVGSNVIQRIHIYSNSVIGAGSLVLKDVPANQTVYGVPAKEVKV